MIETSSMLLLLALLAIPLSWAVPSSLALDAVALWTAAVLVALAPVSALWLLAVALVTPLALEAGARTGLRNFAAALWSVALIAAFVGARLSNGIIWIGGAFFTLRALHVVGDWWMERLPAPTLRAHLRYQLFLPVIAAGPIHRFETFERQARRRRWDPPMFFEGAERALVGAFSALVVGGWLLGSNAPLVTAAAVAGTSFLHDWGHAAGEWIWLYFVFAGYSSIALGISMMIGLRLDENFDRPWAARNLIDFWMRWHMSLTLWCRDYVFRPVVAISRSPVAGLCAAMLAIGLWHEFSAYYVLWATWQVLGVLLTRLAGRLFAFDRLPRAIGTVLGPVSVLAWLSLARPVLTRLLGLIG